MRLTYASRQIRSSRPHAVAGRGGYFAGEDHAIAVALPRNISA